MDCKKNNRKKQGGKQKKPCKFLHFRMTDTDRMELPESFGEANLKAMYELLSGALDADVGEPARARLVQAAHKAAH